MKIKTNDNVKVLSGRDRGKSGKVLQVLKNKRTKEMYVVVEGVNLRKKHLRPKQKSEPGRVIELAAPIHMSKVMVIDPGSKRPTRVGFKLEGEAKKRVARRSGEFLS